MVSPQSSRSEELRTSSVRYEDLSDRRIVELSDSENEYDDMGTATPTEVANITYLQSVTIPIIDTYLTETSATQNETLEAVLPFLQGNPNGFPLNEFGLPQLQRPKHVRFLSQCLGDYPSMMAVMDASRPWLVYWSLAGMAALGQNISGFRDRVIETFTEAQHPEGGYGGGFGQLPHLAATYAATLSLVMVGEDSAYESINRKAMWHYLGRMKQADGGFTMSPGGEEDIRGAYCAMVVMSLLDIPLELPPDAPARAKGLNSFVDKLGEWVSACQGFEGGISAAPGNEAHGAYAFCGLGCLAILGSPKETLHKYLDIPQLIHWLSARQCAPEGGYNGRTNKLVDGCYSHWVGGCWAIVEAAVGRKVCNRTALARYILSAAQAKKGGLIDKPGKMADGYHTNYNLAGLSAVQHEYVFDEDIKKELGQGGLGAPYHWESKGLYEEEKVWGEEDIVNEVHPIFVIPFKAAEDSRQYFEAKKGF